MKCSQIELLTSFAFVFVLCVINAKQIDANGKTKPERQRQAKVSNFFLSSKKLSFSEASVFCSDLNGKLLSIENREKDEQAQSTLIRNGIVSSPVWTSGMYEKGSDVWIWGSNTAKFNYTNWISGLSEHKTPPNTQCVYLLQDSNKKYGWDDTQCSHEFRFICEL